LASIIKNQNLIKFVIGVVMSLVLFFGYFAGFLTTVSLVPQVIKTWKTKSATDFSLAMLLTWWSGIVCWIIYGVLVDAKPIILWNLGTLFLAGSILIMKLKFKGGRDQTPSPSTTKKKPVKTLQDWGV
jgi:MtN3 and saliva related transmembrane protein